MNGHRYRLGIVAGVMMIVAAATIMVASHGGHARADGEKATVVLETVDATVVGAATFTQMGDRVQVEVTVNGLPPGFHGFHVHAVGVCDAAMNFTTAGGHFNPGGHTHGDHAGDQPSLYVHADGTGMLAFTMDRYTLVDLFDTDGSALIVHALPDNFANIPTRYAPDGPDDATLNTGDSGGRIACGVIRREP